MMTNKISIELTELELDTLHTYLASTLNDPDYWPGVTRKQDAALARVLSKCSDILLTEGINDR